MFPKNNNAVSNFISDDKEEKEEENFFEHKVNDKLEVNPKTILSQKVMKEIKKNSFFQ